MLAQYLYSCRAHWRPHTGANGVADPLEKWMKIKKRKHAKRAFFSVLQNAPFRSQIFKNFFASGGKRALIPLTKILRTFLVERPSVCLSVPSFGRRLQLRRVCCCGPGGLEISIDCCTAGAQHAANASSITLPATSTPSGAVIAN